MKKKNTQKVKLIFVATYTFLSSIISLNAQNNWKTTGNNGLPPNAITATSFLGTTNGFPLQLRTTQAQPIKFQTNGLDDKMVLGANGRLALGTNYTTPLFHLDIQTPNPTSNNISELLLRARSSADNDAYIGFVNEQLSC